jgi:hypothetical protein
VVVELLEERKSPHQLTIGFHRARCGRLRSTRIRRPRR